MEKELRNTGFHIEKIVPLNTFTQLCNVLHEVIIDDREFNKLVQYEHLTYPNFEALIKEKKSNSFDKLSYVIPEIPQQKEIIETPYVRRTVKRNVQSRDVSDNDSRTFSR